MQNQRKKSFFFFEQTFYFNYQIKMRSSLNPWLASFFTQTIQPAIRLKNFQINLYSNNRII
jgi:hypothetical protein